MRPGDRGPDPRLVNAAVAGYCLLELIVIVYIAVQIARGYLWPASAPGA